MESSDHYAAVLDRVSSFVQIPIFIRESIEVQLGACIGISRFPDNGQDAMKLVRLADQAMYQAKKSGQNHIHSFEKNNSLTEILLKKYLPKDKYTSKPLIEHRRD